MLYTERKGVHEVEYWTRDAQLRNYIYERPSKATYSLLLVLRYVTDLVRKSGNYPRVATNGN